LTSRLKQIVELLINIIIRKFPCLKLSADFFCLGRGAKVLSSIKILYEFVYDP
jgi:hypothetical protein